MKARHLTLLLSGILLAGAWIYQRQRMEIADAKRALAQVDIPGKEAQAPLGSAGGENSTGSPSGPTPEVVRLRGEVGVLRREVAELEHSTGTNSPSSNDWNLVYGGARPSEHPDFVRFDGLTNVGFASPESAFQTFNFAMQNQSREPLTNTKMKELWDVPDDYDQPPGYNIHLGEGMYGGSGYRIVAQGRLGPDQVRLTIDYEKSDGSSYRREKIMVQHAGRWRMKPVSVTRSLQRE